MNLFYDYLFFIALVKKSTQLRALCSVTSTVEGDMVRYSLNEQFYFSFYKDSFKSAFLGDVFEGSRNSI